MSQDLQALSNIVQISNVLESILNGSRQEATEQGKKVTDALSKIQKAIVYLSSRVSIENSITEQRYTIVRNKHKRVLFLSQADTERPGIDSRKLTQEDINNIIITPLDISNALEGIPNVYEPELLTFSSTIYESFTVGGDRLSLLYNLIDFASLYLAASAVGKFNSNQEKRQLLRSIAEIASGVARSTRIPNMSESLRKKMTQIVETATREDGQSPPRAPNAGPSKKQSYGPANGQPLGL